MDGITSLPVVPALGYQSVMSNTAVHVKPPLLLRQVVCPSMAESPVRNNKPSSPKKGETANLAYKLPEQAGRTTWFEKAPEATAGSSPVCKVVVKTSATSKKARLKNFFLPDLPAANDPE
ncbi:MAG: hypothetical protein KDE31_13250 [Caldilineaceae bacterium]|nr:hypothetical protein [Caldilineaceae bacterium]